MENSKKQTAVDWLDEIASKGFISPENFEQAKETEKQQTIEFAEWCLSELLDGSEPKAETMQGLLEIFKNK